MVQRIWEIKSLSSPIPFFAHSLSHFFSMHERAPITYQSDNSGAFSELFLGNNVPEKNRIDHHTHEGLKRTFTKFALALKTQRFVKDHVHRLHTFDISDQWRKT
jgi:hypothetical protein